MRLTFKEKRRIYGKKGIEIFINIIKGFLIGATDVIPGVSGSTTALILRVYDRVIRALKNLTSALGSPSKWDAGFLFPLMLGLGIAIITMSKVIPFAIDNFPNATFSFFLGLIIMSAVMLIPTIKNPKNFNKNGKEKNTYMIWNIFFGILGFLTTFFLTGITSIRTSHSFLFLFVSGFLAITAMLLPGISGSFVLLILGQYRFIFESIHLLNKRIWHLLVFGLGVLIGIKSTATAMDFLLRKHHEKTMSFLIGLMLGALRLPFNKIINAISQGSSMLISVVFVFFGIALILILNKIAEKAKKEKSRERVYAPK